MATDFFGSVTFSQPVVLSSDLPSHMWWYMRSTITGKLIYVYFSDNTEVESETMPEPYEAEWDFTRQSRSVLRRLRWLAATGQSFSFRLDSITGTGALHPTEGVTDVKHFSGKAVPLSVVKNTKLDFWNGTIKVLVSRSKVRY